MKKLIDKNPFGKLPATYGGEGWQPRKTNLRDEINAGTIWHSCGYQSESAILKEVLLSWPGEELEFSCTPDELLMLARPDLKALRRQAEKVALFYESQGVIVHFAKPSSPPPPNFLFQRDLFWATPEGVVLARPAALQRAGEERYTAEALTQIGVPIIMHFRGTATFEGADALWLDKKSVLLGIGMRTNSEAAQQLAAFLRKLDVELIETILPQNSQHLLGIVNFVAPDLAVVHGGKMTQHLAELLSAKGIRTVILPDSDDVNIRLGMNFVTLAPNRIIMPSVGNETKARLTDHGIEVYQIDISEYLKAAGGLACATGIIRRESV